MTSRFPTFETILTSVAGLSLGIGWHLPPSPWLAPSLVPATLALSGVWLGWCLWRLDRGLTQWRAWHHTTVSLLDPAALPRGDGVFLGYGFRWQTAHTQTLVTALREDGLLPVDPSSQGGYPALQAVGAADTTAVRLPWSELAGQMGLLGTTRSGKTTVMELLLVQLIGEDDAR